MPPEALILDCIHRAHEAEEFVVAGRLQAPGDLEHARRMVRAGLTILEAAPLAWRNVQEELWDAAEDIDLQVYGEALREAFAESRKAIERVISYLDQCHPGYEPAGDVERLREGLAEVKRLADELENRWPWVDAGRFQGSGEESPWERGRPAKEVFDELRRRVR